VRFCLPENYPFGNNDEAELAESGLHLGSITADGGNERV